MNDDPPDIVSIHGGIDAERIGVARDAARCHSVRLVAAFLSRFVTRRLVEYVEQHDPLNHDFSTWIVLQPNGALWAQRGGVPAFERTFSQDGVFIVERFMSSAEATPFSRFHFRAYSPDGLHSGIVRRKPPVRLSEAGAFGSGQFIWRRQTGLRPIRGKPFRLEPMSRCEVTGRLASRAYRKMQTEALAIWLMTRDCRHLLSGLSFEALKHGINCAESPVVMALGGREAFTALAQQRAVEYLDSRVAAKPRRLDVMLKRAGKPVRH